MMMNGDVELGPVSINGGSHYGNQDDEGYENDGFELHEETNWLSNKNTMVCTSPREHLFQLIIL